jgi:hypothetical protein
MSGFWSTLPHCAVSGGQASEAVGCALCNSNGSIEASHGPGRTLRVGDDEYGGGALQDAAQAAVESLGVQSCKALVEDDEVGLLE